jgi:hypothetical protein
VSEREATMPRNVRNFWIEVNTNDGTRKKPLRTGPVSKDGGFDIKILMRDDGEVSDKEIWITGRIMADGTLVVSADVPDPTILVSDNNRSAILQSTKR